MSQALSSRGTFDPDGSGASTWQRYEPTARTQAAPSPSQLQKGEGTRELKILIERSALRAACNVRCYGGRESTSIRQGCTHRRVHRARARVQGIPGHGETDRRAAKQGPQPAGGALATRARQRPAAFCILHFALCSCIMQLHCTVAACTCAAPRGWHFLGVCTPGAAD